MIEKIKSTGISRALLIGAACAAAAGCVDDLQGEGVPAPEEELLSTAEQLVSCSGNGCNGIDPNTTPCASGAVTVAGSTRNIYRNGTSILIGQVELRWSAACGTNWARVSRSDGAVAEGMYATITRADGLSYTDFHTGFYTIWSRMVYAPSQCASARGLVDQSWTSGSNSTPCL